MNINSNITEARELIAGFLRNRRVELGMTQEELAEKTGLHVHTIKRIEAAKFWLKLDTLLVVCHHLNLFFFVEEKDANTPTAKLMRERWGVPSKN